MDRGRYERLQDLFDRARALSPAERSGFLDVACGGDAALRSDVDRLLAHHDHPIDLLKEGAGAAGADLLARELAGAETERRAPEGGGPALPQRIGRYRILGLLGQGGMGIVYEAEQEEPRREVALKVLHSRIPSAGLLARFRLEAEVLGKLEHPGIARIYEAGTQDMQSGGQPFFAMERVAGRPLLEFVRGSCSGLVERLELVARICDAVHHAHQKGIIHRDLKPSNILVDERSSPPQPKILDFGVARATHADVQCAAVETSVGQIIGTIPYMSPEQASGDPEQLDTRSDVYSLGVILYEILAGRLPYDLRGLPIAEMARAIQEKEPVRLGALDPRLRGDVERIAQRALEKERDRRYASAQEMAEDIRRHLRHEPITARPMTTLYQIYKFARRNRALVAGAAVAFAAMLGGTIVSTWQGRMAIKSRNLAEEKTAAARHQAFRARLAAAAAAIEARDPFAFWENKEAIEPQERRWEWHYLTGRLDLCTAVFLAGEPIAGASFDADGSTALLVLSSGALVEWRPEESGAVDWPAVRGEKPVSRMLCPDPLSAAAFSNGGRLVAAVQRRDRRAVGLWESATGRKLSGIAELAAPCLNLAIRDDGRWVVLRGEGRNVWIWDGSSAPPRALGENDVTAASTPRPIAFIPKTDEVAIVSSTSRFGIHDLVTGALVRQSEPDTSTIQCVTFTRDGSVIGFGERAHKIYFGDMRTGLPLLVLRGHRGPVRSLAFGPDEEQVASAGDRTVRLWDLPSGKAGGVFTGHAAEIREVRFHPGGATLLSIAEDHTARVWDLRGTVNPAVCNAELSHPRGAAFTPDGEQVITFSWHDRVEFWDAAAGERAASFLAAPPGKGTARGTCMDASHRGRPAIVTGYREGTLCVWDGRSGALLASTQAHTGLVFRVEFSRDGSRIASSSAGTVKLWSAPDLTPIASIEAGQGPHGGLAFSPDGKEIAIGAGKEVWILDAARLVPARKLAGHAGDVSSLAFSRDGGLIASGSHDGAIRIWEARDGAFRRGMRGHAGAVNDLDFTPEGARLASGSDDTTIRIWDVASGEHVLQLGGAFDVVHAVRFSPDGNRLATASGDGFLRFWDTDPAWVRWTARRRRRHLLEEIRPRVEDLRAGEAAFDGIFARVESDPWFTGERRKVALQEALRLQLERGSMGPAEK